MTMNNPKATLAELFEQVAHSKSLTSSHQQLLILARREQLLSEDDKAAVERLLYAIRRGWLKVVDENN